MKWGEKIPSMPTHQRRSGLDRTAALAEMRAQARIAQDWLTIRRPRDKMRRRLPLDGRPSSTTAPERAASSRDQAVNSPTSRGLRWRPRSPPANPRAEAVGVNSDSSIELARLADEAGIPRGVNVVKAFARPARPNRSSAGGERCRHRQRGRGPRDRGARGHAW